MDKKALSANVLRQALVATILTSVALLTTVTTVHAQRYNFKFGPLEFDLTGSAGIAYDSNITAVEFNAEDDFIATVGLDMNAFWEITRFNSLNLTLGVAYEKYFENSELDSHNNFLLISPETELSLMVYVSNITFKIYDQLSFSIDPSDVRIIGGGTGQDERRLDKYARFQNTFGVQADWDMSEQMRSSFSATRTDLIPIDDDFEELDRTNHAVSGAIYRHLSADLVVGLRAGYFWNDYDENVQNDSEGYSYGGSLTYQISETTNFSATVDHVIYDFEEDGQNDDFSDPDTINYRFILTHDLNENYNHSISYTRTTEYGYVSNTIDYDIVEYRFAWEGLRRTTLEGAISYQWAEESGGFNPEDFERFSVRAGFSYQLLSRLAAKFNYSYWDKESNLFGRDYNRHLVSVLLSYDF